MRRIGQIKRGIAKPLRSYLGNITRAAAGRRAAAGICCSGCNLPIPFAHHLADCICFLLSHAHSMEKQKFKSGAEKQAKYDFAV